MGWYYSFGIVFNNQTDAGLSCNDFKNKKIVLSNHDEVSLDPDVSEHEDNGTFEQKLYILRVFIEGLGTGNTNSKLYETPYFYEIRDFFYDYLKNLNIDFEFAHYELEAADMLMGSETLEYIIYLFENNSKSELLSKKYIDGMVISLDNFNKLEKFKDEFRTFKENYYWLPIKEFKLSN
ncbi:hypothetical protein [Chryseobacterium sp. JUb7]|uniref:hypothetical protein n=1 Tax=Chryseobacterium sp. JUb7 TaxID=2940599 RepID=UPI0021680BF6|nr:hypothetical protein [Chryseobacterium sp. JUb7]MCS3531554.1 hypothetical protein [Chryseobacterium sp. JUb7]